VFNQGQKQQGPQAGTDLEYQVTVDFWTAIRGGVARLQVVRQEVCPTCKGKPSGGGGTCPECQGTGQVTQMGGRMKFKIACPRCGGTGKLENECATCGGEGTVSRTETVEVRIKGRHPRWPADTAGRQGQRRNQRRPRGRSVPHHQDR
jgi:molecular chaperone DnaJ